VLAALAGCRTAAMGGRIHQCNLCGARTNIYNSCGDRHCPKCQGRDRAEWVERQCGELLPVEYFHLVFTVPSGLDVLALAHPAVFYNALLAAVKDTLLELAASPNHLQAQIGGLMVLHTWGQALQLHPHVHVVLPGGGISLDGQRWVSCPRGFFLPVRVLSRKFRGKLLARLQEEHDAGKLVMTGGLADLNCRRRFRAYLAPLYQQEWNVYSKPPWSGPEGVLKYLARYTHRVAISNDRLESIEAGRITFRYKDYAHGGRWRRMTLEADEFLRRFLLHVLPRGFVRIRAFGFLSNGQRAEKLAFCREQLERERAQRTASSAEPENELPTPDEPRRCPSCREGLLYLVGEVERPRVSALITATYCWIEPDDTS
jgi:hypothetical protein